MLLFNSEKWAVHLIQAHRSSLSDGKFSHWKMNLRGYLKEWQEELKLKYPSKEESNKRCLSQETLEGQQITSIQLEPHVNHDLDCQLVL